MKLTEYLNYKVVCLLAGVLLLSGLTACSDDDNDDAALKVAYMEVAGTSGGVVSLTEGDTWNVSVTTYPDRAIDADEYTYSYTSGNEQVFTVDEAGVVTAVGVGEAALTVWSTNNTDMWASCIISVDERIYPVTSIEIPQEYKDCYMPVEGSLKLGELLTVLPEAATNPDVVYSSSDVEVATVNSQGVIYAQAVGDAVITVRAVDGSGVTASCNIRVREPVYEDIDRTGWSISTSHACPPDAAVNGAAESLLDGNLNTCILIVKPGKTLSGVTVGADEEAFFVIDMQQNHDFDYFRLRHRTNNTSTNLRATKVSAFGSNDGEAFEELITDAPVATGASVSEVTISLPRVCNYRYFKLRITGWNASGNSVQMSEFNIGKVVYEQ